MRNKLRRPLAFLLSAVMIVTMSGTPVHAVSDRGQPETGLCEHHTAHTDDCGYTEETPGTPCGHEHTEDCYTEVTECVHEHTPECYPEETEGSVSDNEATPANAKEQEPENCPHICDRESGCITEKLDCRHEHDSECGYTESTPGTPCTFVCEICNPQDSGEASREPETGTIKQEQCSCLTLCTEGQTNPDCPVCGAEDADLSDCKGKAAEEDMAQPEDTGICKHHREHDDACGYQPASEDSEGSPCTYECRVCPVEELIAALPDKVTEDNADDVRARLDEIHALFSELTEGEQEQIDLSRCYELQATLDAANAPMLAADGAATVEVNGATTEYANFQDAWNAANSGGRAVLTLLRDVDVSSALNVASGSDIVLRGDSYAITSSSDYTINVYGTFILENGTIKNTSSRDKGTTLVARPGSVVAINGGVVEGSAFCIDMYGGSLTVTGGTTMGINMGISVSNGGSASISGGNISASAGTGVYVTGSSTLTMTGGTVYGSNAGLRVWCGGESDLSSASLSGGSISGGNYSISVMDLYNRILASSFLAADCAYYDESSSLVDYPETKNLSGAVTIRMCDHSSTRWEQDDTTHRSICRGCKKQLSSASHSFTEIKDLENGNHQFSCECGWVQEPVAHTYGDWHDEDGSHVRSCTVCDAEDRGTHHFRWQDNGDETHTGTCEVCGLTETKAHSFKWKDNGDTHTKTCTDCGKAETAPHNWKWTPVTSIHEGTCTDCGATTSGNHQISGYQQRDMNFHYINCSICGEKAMSVLHRYGSEWVDAGDVHTQSCLDNCGYAKSESHTYGSYQQGDEKGHIFSCKVCGHNKVEVHFAESSWLQADDGHYHLCMFCGWEMERTAHAYDAWKADGAEGHSHTCSVCRYKQSEAHTWDDNQRCTVCGFSAGEVAIVSIEGAEDKTFTELTDAWTYAASISSADKPATVRLMLSTNISNNLEVRTGNNIILEMADGVVLTSSYRGIWVVGGAFTLNSGTVQADGENGISVSGGGTVRINGGTVTAASMSSVYVYGTGSKVYINGGSFSGGRAAVELGWATSQIVIRGGTFSNTNSGGIVFWGDFDAHVYTMIAEGYFVYGPDGNRLSDSDLAVRLLKGGPFMVRECDHSYKYAHEEGTTAHSQVCTLCGHEKDSNCTFTNGACSCGAKLAVTLNGVEGLTYNGAAQEPGVTVTVDGQPLAAENNYTVTYADNTNAGTATVAVTGTSFTGTVEKTFSIGKATLTIKAKDQTITYGENIAQGPDQVTLTALCTGDTLQSVTLAAAGTDITPSAAQIQNASGTDVTGNYDIDYQPGSLTINKAPAPTIIWPAANDLTYGQKLSESTLNGGSTEYGSFAWKNPDTIPTAGTAGHSVTFTPSDSTVQNYEPIATTTQDVDVTVAQATPTVTVAVKMSDSAKGRVADLLVTVTGAQNGAAPAGSLTLTSDGLSETLTLQNGKAAYKWENLSDKEYTVTAAYSGDTNYKAANGQLTFDAAKTEQAALAVSPVEAKTYGDPAFTLATTGGSGSGAVSFTSSDPSIISINGSTATIHKAGDVTITATKAGDVAFNPATATITISVGKKAVVFKAQNVSVQQGDAMPAFTYMPVTLAAGDRVETEPTATCTATDTNTLGTFTITFSGATLTNQDNYIISYEPGTLTITNKPLPPAKYTVTVQAGTGGTAFASPASAEKGT